MFVTRSFLGLITLVITSNGQMHSGRPTDGTCNKCDDVMYIEGVWHSMCTEDFTCPTGFENIENNIKGENATYHGVYYEGVSPFLPGTKHYECNAILASKIASLKEGDLGEQTVPIDHCQRCEVDVGDDWSRIVCKKEECAPFFAKHLQLKSLVPAEDTTRDRICLIRRDGEFTIYTCRFFSNDPHVINHTVLASSYN
ncbi:uncharacterized protein LOC144344210 [Saccoglossus kowalevskii]